MIILEQGCLLHFITTLCFVVFSNFWDALSLENENLKRKFPAVSQFDFLHLTVTIFTMLNCEQCFTTLEIVPVRKNRFLWLFLLHLNSVCIWTTLHFTFGSINQMLFLVVVNFWGIICPEKDSVLFLTGVLLFALMFLPECLDMLWS